MKTQIETRSKPKITTEAKNHKAIVEHDTTIINEKEKVMNIVKTAKTVKAIKPVSGVVTTVTIGTVTPKTTKAVKVSTAIKVSTVPAMKTFAEFVLQLREVLGQTQAELAKLLDVKQNSVSNWELSDTLPRRVVIARIKHVLKTRKLSNWIPVLDRVVSKL